MLKWFRQHSKILLVVFGVLLMIVFLLPAGTDFLYPSQADQTIGYLDGEEITMGDQNLAAAEVDLLEQFTGQQFGFDGLQWLLLVHEGKRHGIYVPHALAMANLRQQLEQSPDMAGLLQRQNVSLEFLGRAYQHLGMVEELVQMMTGAAQVSEPRMRHFARDIQSQAGVEVVAVDAAAVMDSVSEPTAQQVQEQFEKFKDQAAGVSEPYGFGYRLPPRVKLEYLAVPRQAVVESVEVDEVAAHRYYLSDVVKRPERYIPPTPAPPVPVPGPTPGTPEAATPPPAPLNDPLPYKEVRQRVIDELRQQLAAEKQQKIVQEIAASFSENARRLKTDDLGYRTITAEFAPIDLEALARDIQQRYGVLPEIKRFEDGYLTLNEVAKLPGLGEARLELPTGPVSTVQYIASARELKLPSTELASLRLQEGIASRPVTDPQGTAYIFRLLDAEEARAPRNLDEVRAEVVRDLKRVEAYEQLKQRADSLADRAAAEGLEKLATDFKTTVEKMGPFSAYDQIALLYGGVAERPRLPIVNQNEHFLNEVFDLAERVREAGGVKDAPPRQTIDAIPVDKVQKVLVTKLTEYQPIDSGRYEQLRANLPSIMSRVARSQTVRENPLSREALIRRTGYESAFPEEEPAETEAAEEPKQAQR